jgi:hypothetical protein
MQLVAKKKFGKAFTHVRAGRLLRVKTVHPIHKRGSNLDYDAKDGDSDWVFCEEGDLVAGVFEVKKKKFLGYSYLSGPAIGMMRYTEKTPAHYDYDGDEIELRLLKIPVSKKSQTQDEYFDLVRDALRESKKGPMSVSVFSFSTPDQEEAHAFINGIAGYWDECEGTGHLTGVIDIKEDKSVTYMHQQPKEHVGDHPMTGFQTGLLYEKARKK